MGQKVRLAAAALGAILSIPALLPGWIMLMELIRTGGFSTLDGQFPAWPLGLQIWGLVQGVGGTLLWGMGLREWRWGLSSMALVALWSPVLLLILPMTYLVVRARF